MNVTLQHRADELGLDDPANQRMRLEFGYACVARVGHLLEDENVSSCLLALAQHLAGSGDLGNLAELATEAAQLANHHEGSRSIDGCGHAAVSATYAVSKALEGKALEAASYAAYAAVYAQGGSAVVADRESFEAEFQWQVACLDALAKRAARAHV